MKKLAFLILALSAACFGQASGTGSGPGGVGVGSFSTGGAVLQTLRTIPTSGSAGLSIDVLWAYGQPGSCSVTLTDNRGNTIFSTGASSSYDVLNAPPVTTVYTNVANCSGVITTLTTTYTVIPVPAVTLTCSNLNPVQGNTITCAYTASGSGTLTCSIDHAVLATTTACNGTSSAFTPAFTTPGNCGVGSPLPDTCTTYTFTVSDTFGNTITASQNIEVSPLPPVSGDDNTYCNGPGVNFEKWLGPTTDSLATLPNSCFYTAMSSTPSGLHIGGGAATTWPIRVGTESADLTAAFAGLQCGDIIELDDNTVVSGSKTFPQINCDQNHWITMRWKRVATDPSFPAEGTRANPSLLAGNPLSIPGYPSYPNQALAGAMPRFITTNQAPALQLTNCTGFDPANPGTTSYCASFLRLIGIEATGTPGVRVGGKVITLDGGNHVLFDRGIIHGPADPTFTFQSNGGISINSSYAGLINSWSYDTYCSSAAGNACVDSQAVTSGTGQYYQKTQKVVNNLLASAGESFFTGGSGESLIITADNPLGNVSDIEVRRNHSFKPLLWMLQPPLVVGGNCNPHWIPKNLGEFKSVNRALVEGNVEENSWTGCQTDQNGNGNLLTPKSQSSKTTSGATRTIAGTGTNGLKCIVVSTGADCAAGTGNWSCDLDGSRTVANGCPSVEVFSGLPGAYSKVCPPAGCQIRVTVGSSGTIDYHVASFVDSEHLTAVENTNAVIPTPATLTTATVGGVPTTCTFTANAALGGMFAIGNDALVAGVTGGTGYNSNLSIKSVSGSTFTALCSATGSGTGGTATAHAPTYLNCNRGLNPFAIDSNVTFRYNLLRHVADGFEIASAKSDCQDEALGIHFVSMHDVEGYDIDSTFFTNSASPCCTTGWFFRFEVSTALANTVPSDIDINHNTMFIRGYGGNSQGINMFDLQLKPGNPNSSAAYWPRTKIRNNITAASLQLTNSTGSTHVGLPGVKGGLDVYGSPTNDGANADYVAGKNLMVFLPGYWPGTQGSDIPDVNLQTYDGTGATLSSASVTAGVCTFTATAPLAGFTAGSQVVVSGITGGANFNNRYAMSTVLTSSFTAPCLATGSGTGGTASTHLNSVDICSCTLVANGGTATSCTPGSERWGSAVLSGTLDACDRSLSAVDGYYSKLVNQWDINGVGPFDLTLVPGSPYALRGTDGVDIGANIGTIAAKTAGVASATNFAVLMIDGYVGHTTCSDVNPCALPAATHGVAYTVTLDATVGASPFHRWTLQSGSLPTGTALGGVSAVLSGTPTNCGPGTTAPCTATFTARVEDAGHQKDTQSYTLLVN